MVENNDNLFDLQRIRKVVNWYIFQEYGKNDAEIAAKLGYTKSSFSQILNGQVPISQKFVDKLCAIDNNINKVWISGVGEMLRNKSIQDFSNTSDRYENQYQRKDTRNIIPLYSDVSSFGGNNEYSANMEGVTQPIEYIDTGDWFRDATAAIRHYGESMMEYPPGSILALKETHKEHIIWGEHYVIETSEHRITKRVQRGKNEDYIKACSSNTEVGYDGQLIHEHLDIHWKNIHKIFLVLGYVVKRNGGTMVYSSKK